MPDVTFQCAELPAMVLKLLWSYDRSPEVTLPLAAVAAVVMERGDLSAMRWLLHTAGREPLREALPHLARRLSPRSLALWRCILDAEAPEPPRVPWVAA